MDVLVLQHMDGGHPWYLRELLRESGTRCTTLRPDRGDALPPVESCEALWVMGGAPQVWQDAEHPWLRAEKRFIRRAVEAGVPYLGVCLGHQLLAAALGGEVGMAERPEVGLFEVSPTPEGRDSPWLAGCGAGPRLQWHEAEVTRPPPRARVLAQSERCAVQAMAVGDSAFSVQYHVEADNGTLPAWCESDTARQKLDTVFGEGGLGYFQRLAIAELQELREHASGVFANWLQSAARR